MRSNSQRTTGVWVFVIAMTSAAMVHPSPRVELLPPNRSVTVSLRPGGALQVRLPALSPAAIYSLSVTVCNPSVLKGSHGETFVASPSVFNMEPQNFRPVRGAVHLALFRPNDRILLSKRLWWGDPSLFVHFQPKAAGDHYLELKALDGELKGAAQVSVQLLRLNLRPEEMTRIEREPNDTPEDANPMEIGKPVYGTGDDVDYLYNTDEGKNGWDWFTFEWRGEPKLVFFEVDLLDRDVITTLKLFKQEQTPDGKTRLVEYTQGKDPTEVRHDDQGDELLAWKFVTRVLTPGRYYLAVRPNHPVYTLRTAIYDVPPYLKPEQMGKATPEQIAAAARKAIAVAMRYMVDGGDSFFHNTPRKGGIRVRAENQTDETERCLTCHPGHFTMFSVLSAVKQGYPIANRSQFKWMMDKLYNAMAPFYGHEGAYWTRFDLAPANGVSRLGHMIVLYENYFSGRKTNFPAKAGGFPLLVYRGRDKLPQVGYDGNPKRNFEHDGNRPISDFRVACDSWVCFVEAYKRTGDEKWLKAAQHLESLIRTGRLKDTEDIVEQTKWALYMSDPRFGYVDRLRRDWDDLIEANVQELLRRQQDDGGWLTAEYLSNAHYFPAWELAEKVKKSDPSLVFFTAETVYVLAMALEHLGDIQKPSDILNDPRLAKAVRWILTEQKEFGAWLDQKGELFFTPYLETKWALILLSHLFPGEWSRTKELAQAKQVTPPQMDRLTYTELLDWLDGLWAPLNGRIVRTVLPLLKHDDPLIRQKAAAAIGQMACDTVVKDGLDEAVEPLIGLLTDDAKMVWRSAAWALRQLANNGIGVERIKAALSSDDPRVRRGATRVFLRYFYHLVDRKDIAERLCTLTQDDDPLVRVHALQSLWRWWYRTTDYALRRTIERAFLQLAAKEREPLVRLNIAQALHNILDENTVQFFNNWLRVVHLDEDKERAKQVRVEMVERPLARAVATTLRQCDDVGKETVLTAFGYFYLRGGVGNDYDFITFYDQQAAQELAEALLPLLDHPDTTLRLKATKAAVAARMAKDVRLVTKLMERLKDVDAGVRQAALQALRHPAFPADYRVFTPTVAQRSAQ